MLADASKTGRPEQSSQSLEEMNILTMMQQCCTDEKKNSNHRLQKGL